MHREQLVLFICSLSDEGFPDRSTGKKSACNAGDTGLILVLERSAEEGIGYPLQYFWTPLVAQLVKNPPAMRETWVDPWVRKNPWRRERVPTPVGIQSMGSQRVRHD